MQLSHITQSSVLLASLLLSAAELISSGGAIAQQALPTCQPPRPNEYLLLVPNRQADTQAQLQKLLPANAVLTACNYMNDGVIRVEGFSSTEIASAWARYLGNVAGLQAVVARPSTVAAPPPTASNSTSTPQATPASSTTAGNFPTPTQIPIAPASGGPSSAASFPSPTATPTPNPSTPPAVNPAPGQAPSPAPNSASSFPSPTITPAPGSAVNPVTAPVTPGAPTPGAPTPGTGPAPGAATAPGANGPPNPSYSPQPLGNGYAVLVNYFSRPEVAADVHQVTTREVGLVAYEQQPYLLAAYTPDAASADAIFRNLSDRGFVAFIVDSRRTILLTPAVVGTGR